MPRILIDLRAGFRWVVPNPGIPVMKTAATAFLTTFALLLAACGEKKPAAGDAGVTPDGAYVLAKKDVLPPVGTVLTKDQEMKMEAGAVTLQAGGQELNGTMDRTMRSKETTEILGADRLRRLLVSKEESGEMKLNGQAQPTPGTPDPLLGLPALLERKDGTWTATLENGSTPSAAQKTRLETLAQEANRDSDFAMYGDTPRKPGDKWDVDPSKLSNFGVQENLSGTFTVQFLKIEEFKGESCALLNSTFDMKGKSAGEGGTPPMDVRLKGEALSRRSTARMIDLDAQINATMTIDGAPGPGFTMHVEGPMKMSEMVTVKAP